MCRNHMNSLTLNKVRKQMKSDCSELKTNWEWFTLVFVESSSKVFLWEIRVVVALFESRSPKRLIIEKMSSNGINFVFISCDCSIIALN